MKKPDYIVCRYCGVDMIEWRGVLLNFPLDMNNVQDYSSHAMDKEFICPICNLVSMFGVAISKEFYEKYKKLYGKGDRFVQY